MNKSFKFWLKVIVAVLSALLAALGGDTINLTSLL